MSLFLLSAFLQSTTAVLPTPAEMDEQRAWVMAHFEGSAQTPQVDARIDVLANLDPVQLNSRHGKPMCLAGKPYTRGLYCHATSLLEVYLPEPGVRFEAVAGVDSNEQTSGGRGCVSFAVVKGEEVLWKSGVQTEASQPLAVDVALNGATSFKLNINEEASIACDQADWADARVTLASGAVIWLADLPLRAASRKEYDTYPVFSFNYDGKPSSGFLSGWDIKRSVDKLDDVRTRHILLHTDPATALEARVEGIVYSDFPVVEWTIHFKNNGPADTPILSDINAIDTLFQRASQPGYVLHHHTGDNCVPDSYEPHTLALAPSSETKMATSGGRPTQTVFPYFNINWGGEGVIQVMSWAGQWAQTFTRDTALGLRISGGQELTHFLLHPGEEVRGPMVVLMFYKGDWMRSQNVWRQWMVAHNIPRPEGAAPKTPMLFGCSSHQFGEMVQADRDSQILFVDKYAERGFKLDYWWMDAGWYICDGQWPKTGTWEVDEARFPGGLRVISDHARANDVKTIVWFEPERVQAETWLTLNHPEWILGGAAGGLLNLGNPEAWNWLVNHVDKVITDQGIDLYRQDFNMDPLTYWCENDTEDRQGITEIRHIEGYYAYWDELLRRHPGMLIDSCASGGRRNDLETLRRAIPLWRSDYIMEPTGNQCISWALPLWIPFHGTGTSSANPYLIQSVLCPSFNALWDMRDDSLDYELLRRITGAWKDYGSCYYGDYYPLTSHSLKEDAWIAWEFVQTDAAKAVIQVFRRPESIYEAGRMRLQGLDPAADYLITDVSENGPDQPTGSRVFMESVKGSELMENGLRVEINQAPGVAFLVLTMK